MKEYKIVRQKSNLLKNNDREFEDELNKLAREGWWVINSVCMADSYALKVVLEKDKNR